MLKLENVSKFYGKTKALDGLNLEIEAGSIYGFVGPNGAGKTTTMKLVAGLIEPDQGLISIDGVPIKEQSKQLRQLVGYMPDFFGVYDNLLVKEYLQFFGELFELPPSRVGVKIDELLELVELSDKKNEPVDALSRGMKQRLCLARALLHEPKLLLLDEPASGMDPLARIHMKNILKTLSQRGQTILISSHILPELSEIATAIGIIHQGKMIQQGSIESLEKTLSSTLTIQLRHLKTADRGQLEAALSGETAISSFRRLDDHTLVLELKGDEADAARLMNRLCQTTELYHFQVVSDSLEDLFKKAMTTGGIPTDEH